MKCSILLSFFTSIVTLVVSSTDIINQHSWLPLRHRDISRSSYWTRDLDQEEWISSLVPRASPKSSGSGGKSGGSGAKPPGNSASQGDKGGTKSQPSKSVGSKSDGSVKQGQARTGGVNPVTSQGGKSSQGGSGSKRLAEGYAHEPPAQKQKKSSSGPSTGAARIGGRVAGTSKSAFQKIPPARNQNPSVDRHPAFRQYQTPTSPTRSRVGTGGASDTGQNLGTAQGSAGAQGQPNRKGDAFAGRKLAGPESSRLGRQGSTRPTNQGATRFRLPGGIRQSSTSTKSNLFPPAAWSSMKGGSQRPGVAGARERSAQGGGESAAATRGGKSGRGRGMAGDAGGRGSGRRGKVETTASGKEADARPPASRAQVPTSLNLATQMNPWGSIHVGNSAATRNIAMFSGFRPQERPTQNMPTTRTGTQPAPVQAEIPNRRIVSGQGASARPIGTDGFVD